MTKGKSRTKPPTHARSLEDLAAALGLSRRYVIELRRRGMPPAKTSQGYAIDAARRWYEENVTSYDRPAGRNGTAGDLRDELTREQILKRRVERQIKELERKRLEAELISKEEAEEWNLTLISVFKRQLLGMTGTIGNRFVGLTEKEIRSAWRKTAREILEKLASM